MNHPFEEMRNHIASTFEMHPDEITPDLQFEDAGFDSLDLVILTMSLEEIYGITISDAEVDRMLTFGDLFEVVQRIRINAGKISPVSK